MLPTELAGQQLLTRPVALSRLNLQKLAPWKAGTLPPFTISSVDLRSTWSKSTPHQRGCVSGRRQRIQLAEEREGQDCARAVSSWYKWWTPWVWWRQQTAGGCNDVADKAPWHVVPSGHHQHSC
jgi:hypothetical protein